MFNFAQQCAGMALLDAWLQWLAEQQVDLFRRAVIDSAMASRLWLTNSVEERRLFLQ
jgi:hypothetical protein